MQQNSSLYVDSCPECDSLEVRLIKVISEELDELQVEVRCEECGVEWIDYVGAQNDRH
jgi:uncharacterized Zn finger protein